jgi:hypothetical protein
LKKVWARARSATEQLDRVYAACMMKTPTSTPWRTGHVGGHHLHRQHRRAGTRSIAADAHCAATAAVGRQVGVSGGEAPRGVLPVAQQARHAVHRQATRHLDAESVDWLNGTWRARHRGRHHPTATSSTTPPVDSGTRSRQRSPPQVNFSSWRRPTEPENRRRRAFQRP